MRLRCKWCGKWHRRKVLVTEWIRDDMPPNEGGNYILKYPSHVPGCYHYQIVWFNATKGWCLDTHGIKEFHGHAYWTAIPDSKRDLSECPEGLPEWFMN